MDRTTQDGFCTMGCKASRKVTIDQKTLEEIGVGKVTVFPQDIVLAVAREFGLATDAYISTTQCEEVVARFVLALQDRGWHLSRPQCRLEN